jgi:hypothetical protein
LARTQQVETKVGFLETYVPKLTAISASILIILVIADAYIVGGVNLGRLGIGLPGNASITNLMNVNTRSTIVITIVMTYSLVQLYWRRLRGQDRAMQRKGLFFFVGMFAIMAVGIIYGPLSQQYSIVGTVISQAVNEGGQYWIGVVYAALIVRGYMVRSKEGLLMAAVGLIELWGVSNLGSVFLPQLGDFGIWIMRYPSLGVNNVLWLTQYVGVVVICGRIIIGKQKLRARR